MRSFSTGVGEISDAVLDGVVEPLELGVRLGCTLAQFGNGRCARSATNNLDPVCFSDRGGNLALRVVPSQAAKTSVQTDTCNPKPTGCASLLLSGHRSGGGLRPAVPAQPFAKLRSDKTQIQHVGSRLRAGSLQLLRRLSDGRTCVTHRRVDRRSDTGAAAVVPVVCRSDAGRRPGRRVSVECGNVRYWWIADDRADMAISTRMTPSGHRARVSTPLRMSAQRTVIASSSSAISFVACNVQSSLWQETQSASGDF